MTGRKSGYLLDEKLLRGAEHCKGKKKGPDSAPLKIKTA